MAMGRNGPDFAPGGGTKSQPPGAIFDLLPFVFGTGDANSRENVKVRKTPPPYFAHLERRWALVRNGSAGLADG